MLGAYTDDLSDSARLQLERLGVSVWTGMKVTGVDALGVCIGPERIDARTVLWAAGVAASPLAQTLGVPLDRAGRVLVRADLTIPGRDDVYVIGDLAHVEFEGGLVPGVATGRDAGGSARRPWNIGRARRGEAKATIFLAHQRQRACWPQLAGVLRGRQDRPGSARRRATLRGCSGSSSTFSF